MNCPKCQTELPGSAKFCFECGHQLESVCGNCQTLNPPGSKFCIECGTDISRANTLELSSLDEKIDKIQRYLPAGLTQKILAQRDRIEGERKIVTVLFCDLVGY
ncbi:zinc ribbon domain-containing protein, partial [bacterium]|nr:zinc ribbon domain-containing protein [bacterium]